VQQISSHVWVHVICSHRTVYSHWSPMIGPYTLHRSEELTKTTLAFKIQHYLVGHITCVQALLLPPKSITNACTSLNNNASSRAFNNCNGIAVLKIDTALEIPVQPQHSYMFPLISYWCSSICKLWASQHHSVQCTLDKIWQRRVWRLLLFLALALLGQLAWQTAQAQVSSVMLVICSFASPNPGLVSSYKGCALLRPDIASAQALAGP